MHAFHIEGCGGGHAPDLLALAGRERVLTSSTSPTVPFGVGAEAEHLAMVAAVHVLAPGARAGDWTALRHRVRPQTMAAEGVLHDLGVIAMLSSDSQGMGRIGEVYRRALQNADVMKRVARRRARRPRRQRADPAPPGQGHDQPGDHARARGRRRLARGRQARRRRALVAAVLPACGPSSCSRAAIPAWGASGDGNATTMLSEPVLVQRQVGAQGAAAARLSLAFLAGAAMDAELPITRPRARVQGCRELTAADMVRNARRGTVRVDPRTYAVTLDGEPVFAPPVERVAFSDRFLLG